MRFKGTTLTVGMKVARSPTHRLHGRAGTVSRHDINVTHEQPMTITTRGARITGPVNYFAESGQRQQIPVGPCLIESEGGQSVDIVWGEQGQSSAALPVEVLTAAQACGSLVLLD